MSENGKHKITVTLTQPEGEISWSTSEELRVWLNALHGDWGWLASVATQPTNDAWGRISTEVQQIRDLLDQAIHYRSAGQSDTANNYASQARNRLQTWLHQFPWLLARSRDYQFLMQVRDGSDNRVAGLIVALMMAINIQPNLQPFEQDRARAVVTLELYRRGIKDRTQGEQRALAKLADEQGRLLVESKAEAEAARVRLDALATEAGEAHQLQQHTFDMAEQARSTTFDTAEAQRKVDWDQRLTQAQKQLEQLTKTYDQHMALASPVRYWDNKRKRHANWAIGSGIVTFLAMLLVAVVLICQLNSARSGWQQAAKSMVSERSRVASAQDKPADQQTTPAQPVASSPEVASNAAGLNSWHFDVAGLVLLATLSFWLVRLLVRVFLSHLHLENDAAERVTMARTYLALLRRDKLPEGDDLRTVLAALFRPSGDGIVKDEGIPPSFVDFMTRMK